jgi:hypothetical protein
MELFLRQGMNTREEFHPTQKEMINLMTSKGVEVLDKQSSPSRAATNEKPQPGQAKAASIRFARGG